MKKFTAIYRTDADNLYPFKLRVNRIDIDISAISFIEAYKQASELIPDEGFKLFDIKEID